MKLTLRLAVGVGIDARELCADLNATLSKEEAELELLREQLTEEIIRVRERRAEHQKHLELEIE